MTEHIQLILVTSMFVVLHVSETSMMFSRDCSNVRPRREPFKMRSYENDLEKLKHITHLKKSILEKLGFNERPIPEIMAKKRKSACRILQKVNDTSPVVKNNKTEKGDFFAEIEEFITFSEPADPFTSENIIQFKVIRDKQGRKLEVKSADLLVKLKYKKKHKRRRRKKNDTRSITLILSTVGDNGKRLKKIKTFHTNVTKTKWFTIRIDKAVVEQALATPEGILRLHIRCKGCKRGARLVLVHGSRRRRHNGRKQLRLSQTIRQKQRRKKRRLSKTRPFLILQAKVQTFIRRKRSSRCQRQNGTSVCCKDNLVFNFAEQGWDDWILSPRSFMTGYCYGSCASAAVNRTCEATRMRSLRITYHANNSIVTASLPNLIIDECGCSPQSRGA